MTRKIRCAIVDDERPARARLRRLLEARDDVEICGEAADADAAVALLDREKPDLCFLDVRMPEGDGFSVLERAAHRPGVIFTTAFDEYAVQAFDVRSVDYLRKPFSRARFDAALERALEQLAPGAETADVGELGNLLREMREMRAGARERISARKGSRIVLLDPARVYWFEAEETLVFARAPEGRFLVERTLADLERELDPDFFRCHRRYLVRLGAVSEIVPGEAGTYTVIVDAAEAEIPLSRRQARKLRERIPW